MLGAGLLVEDLGLGHARLPVSLWVGVLEIIDLKLLLESSMGIEKIRLVEGLSLIKPISVLRSLDVRVQILLSFPARLVEQLRIGLKPAGNRLFTVLLPHAIVEFAI